MDWSPQFPELLVASYHNNEDSPHDPDGVCLVWNTRFKKSTPEYIFHCQSPVLSCCFARFHPNLILGGTYSGKIVLWDNRSPKRTPVQRSPLSASAHTVSCHLFTFSKRYDLWLNFKSFAASSLLFERSWHPKFAQSHIYIDRREDVFMEFGHAGSTSRDTGSAAASESCCSCNLYGFPSASVRHKQFYCR